MRTYASAIVALGLFAVVGSAQATVMITPSLPGTVTGITMLQPHEVVKYEFTIPAPYNFLFSFSDGIGFSFSGQSGNYVETFVNGPSSSLGSYSLTTTVPEPASCALLLVGFGGIGAIARRRTTPASA